MVVRQFIAGALLAGTLAQQTMPEAFAYTRYVYRRSGPTYVRVYRRSYFQEHPVVKGTLLGGALGAGAGAIGGAIAGHHRAGRGALIGMGTGAGIGAIESAHEFRGHPIVRNTATGSLLGLGIGLTSRHRGWGGRGAGIGALVGAGLGILRNSNGEL